MDVGRSRHLVEERIAERLLIYVTLLIYSKDPYLAIRVRFIRTFSSGSN